MELPAPRATLYNECFSRLADGEYWLGFLNVHNEYWYNEYRDVYINNGGVDIGYTNWDAKGHKNYNTPDLDFVRTSADGTWTVEGVTNINGVDTTAKFSTVCIKFDHCIEDGYEIFDRNCRDIDECETEAHDCQDNFECVNTPGSFKCECGDGFALVNDECVDINECSDPHASDYCEDNYAGTCVNTIGSYTCDGELVCLDRIFTIHWGKKMYYHDAVSYCDDMGMELPAPTFDLQNQCYSTMGEYWLGITSEHHHEDHWLNTHRGHWVRYSGHDRAYTNWDERGPRDYTDPDMDFLHTNVNGEWVASTAFHDNFYKAVCIKLDRCLLSGFFLNGRQCKDVDECDDETDDCQANFTCINTPGSYICDCGEGFELVDGDCIDIDECSLESNRCSDYAGSCTNTDGSYICEGEMTCRDRIFVVNWSEKRNWADAKSHCESLSMELPSPRHLIMDECMAPMADQQFWLGIDSHGHHEDHWLNTNRGHWVRYSGHDRAYTNWANGSPCDYCSPDVDYLRYDGDGKWQVETGSEKYTTVCVQLDRCVQEGYTVSGRACLDINECVDNTHDCNSVETCRNTPGSFYCECGDGLVYNEDDICEDIDECDLPNNTCSDYGTCTNTDGSYTCDGEMTCDNRIFTIHWSNKRNYWDAKAHCESLDMELPAPRFAEMNECVARLADGEVWLGIDSATITTTEGHWYNINRNSRIRYYRHGTLYAREYQPWGPQSPCDHCSYDKDYARMNAIGEWIAEDGTKLYSTACIKLDRCAHSGYELNESNRSCVDIDECALETHTCDDGYTCNNIPGSFTCECGLGYNLAEDGTCTDIDECVEETVCSGYVSGSCTNTDGSYICDGEVICDTRVFQVHISEKRNHRDAKAKCDELEMELPSPRYEAINTCFNRIADGEYWLGFEDHVHTHHCGYYCYYNIADGYWQNIYRGFTVNEHESIGHVMNGWNNWDFRGARRSDSPDRNFARSNSDGEWVAERAGSGFVQKFTTICIKIDRCVENGYVLSNLENYNDRSCVDIDECVDGSHECPENYTCLNTGGSYECSCGIGFTLLEDESCIDIDECIGTDHTCGNIGTCTNTIGSYQCDGEITCQQRVFSVHWENRRNFVDAFTYCGDLEMELPVPTDDDMNICLSTLADGEFWLGISDSNGITSPVDESYINFSGSGEGYWWNFYRDTWVTGHVSGVYTNWESKMASPCNHCNPDRDFARMQRSYKTWASESGDRLYSSVCIQLDRCLEDGYELNLQDQSRRVCDDIDECTRENCVPDCADQCEDQCTTDGEGVETCNEVCVEVCNDDICTPMHDCGDNFTCINLPGSFTCECRNGFELDDDNCVDIDECATVGHACERYGDCTNTIGSYTCVGELTCREKVYSIHWTEKKNWEEALDYCTSIDMELPVPQEENHVQYGPMADCFKHVADGEFWLGITDRNTEEEWRHEHWSNSQFWHYYLNNYNWADTLCDHYPYHHGNDGRCYPDKDFARTDRNSRWWPEGNYANTKRKYTTFCVKLNRCLENGYTFNDADRKCVDINECTADEIICADQCEDVCEDVCEGEGESEVCEEVCNEVCTEVCEPNPNYHNCQDNFTCINLGGSFTCECREGFVLDGENCVDIDECATVGHGCEEYGTCTNTVGSYTCDGEFICKDRYFKVNWSKKRTWQEARDHCESLDMELPVPMDPAMGYCFNDLADGEFWLGTTDVSHEGYHYSVYTNLRSLDYYTNWKTPVCHHGGSCWPERDYVRTYADGTWFAESGVRFYSTVCVKVDRCVEVGYELNEDNRKCDDINECTQTIEPCENICETDNDGVEVCNDVCTPLHNCTGNFRCLNTAGSFDCVCGSGFLVDENAETCDDIDECLHPSNMCDTFNYGACVNTVGSYTCDGSINCEDRVFSLHWSRPRNYVDARAHCEAMDLELPVPRNSNMMECFRFVADGEFWLGVSDRYEVNGYPGEGQWRDIYRDDFTYNWYENWATGSPDNHGYPDRDFARANNAGQWVTESETNEYSTVCAKLCKLL